MLPRKVPERLWADNILTESDNLDVAVVESVLNGRNYSMSDH